MADLFSAATAMGEKVKSSWKRKGVYIWKPACSTEQRAVTFFFFSDVAEIPLSLIIMAFHFSFLLRDSNVL